jgi:hypothetical protein
MRVLIGSLKEAGLAAGCIDTDLPAGRRNFGQSDKPLIEIAHAHHAMWVTFTETRCRRVLQSLQGSSLDLSPSGQALPGLLDRAGFREHAF